MTTPEPVTIYVRVSPDLAAVLSNISSKLGLSVGTWVGDRLSEAYALPPAPSNRQTGQARRRSVRRARRREALAARHQAPAEATS